MTTVACCAKSDDREVLIVERRFAIRFEGDRAEDAAR
jgi:hypothetical protein